MLALASARPIFVEGQSACESGENFPVAKNGPVGPHMFGEVADRYWWFSLMCGALWGDTAADALYDLVGQHLKHKDNSTCRRWARGRRQPEASVLFILIRSREGHRVQRFITEIAGPPTPYAIAVRSWQRKAELVDQLCNDLRADQLTINQ
jgi:hypothetical protein